MSQQAFAKRKKKKQQRKSVFCFFLREKEFGFLSKEGDMKGKAYVRYNISYWPLRETINFSNLRNDIRSVCQDFSVGGLSDFQCRRIHLWAIKETNEAILSV